VASETVTASLLNTHLRDNLADLQTRLTGAGSSFTITSAGSAGVTIGNATQANTWKLLSEKFAFFRIRLVFGTTSSFSASFQIGPLPFTVAGTDDQIAWALCKDTTGATARYPSIAWLNGTQAFRILALDGGTGVTNTSPFTWTTGDELNIQGVVETT
jgi:hypothetical protein